MSTPEPPVFAEKFPQTAYFLDGITWLPHYRNPGMFVCPGVKDKVLIHRQLTAHQLEMRGAEAQTLQLWSRS